MMASFSYIDEDDQKAPKKGFTFVDDPAPAPKREAGTADRVGAVLSGVNRGLFADLLGLPVDTVANVLDLGKAGIGTAYQAASGKPAPDWTLPDDRANVLGTSEWIAAKTRQGAKAVGVASPLDMPNPDDKTSRILHAGGRVAGSSIVPGGAATARQQAANAAMSFGSGALAGAVGEDNPEWAGVAGMLPSVAGRAISAGTKYAARGGESGRQRMEQRIFDLSEGGIDRPSLGLATGNKTIAGLENMAAQTPGQVGLYDRARQANVDGMNRRVDQIRDTASPTRGALEAGRAMQDDVQGAFKKRISDTYGKLNDKFVGQVPRDQRFPIPNTLESLRATTAIDPLAPNTTAEFVQPRIAKLRDNITADSSVTERGLDYQTRTRNVGLPLATTKKIRTDIGDEAASRAIFGTPEQGDFKRVYASLSEDMRGAARATDARVGPQPATGGPAEAALNRSNRYYSAGMDRAKDLTGLTNNPNPERAFDSLANSLKSGGTLYAKLRNAITPETRGKIVATVVDEMGHATPGRQNAEGDVWSPATFLTNYNRIDPGARKELFKRVPGGAQLADDLAKVAKAADMGADSSKIWSNPSGTTPALVARGAFGALTIGAFIDPATAAWTAGGLVAGNQMSKRLLLNPKFVNWLARAETVRPGREQAHAQRLIATANMTNDEQFRQDVQDYLSDLEQR